MHYIFHVLAGCAFFAMVVSAGDVHHPKTPIVETIIFSTFLICGQIARVAWLIGEEQKRVLDRNRTIPSRAFVEVTHDKTQ